MVSRVRSRPSRPSRPPQRVNVETPCQKYGSESLACKEYELSQLRSTPVAVRRSGDPSIPFDPQIAFPLSSGGMGVLNIIGEEVDALEQQIKKNEMSN